MILAVTAVIAGIAVLAWSADQFVLGASRVALIKRVPALVVGVVIIGFGTSVPELLVSTLATANGETAVAVGNIVGSNLANLSLLLGIGAILVPLTVTSTTVRREAPLVVLAVVGFGIAVQNGGVSPNEGLALFGFMAVAMYVIARPSKGDVLASEVIDLAEPHEHRLSAEAVRTGIGLAGTVGASQLLLWGALEIATRADLSEGFVGATLVAIGTSLPELVTVVQSARRKETDLIVGNLLGSNLFNALAVGGTIGLVGADGLDNTSLSTVAVIASIVVAVLAAVAMTTGRAVSRREGIALVLIYLGLLPFLA